MRKRRRKRSVLLKVNGDIREVFIKPSRTLLEVLRHDLHLTGAKESCGIGACGVCTVLVNGKPVNSCITLAIEVEGQEIETIEGLGEAGTLHPLQNAFIEHHAFQCGFCTPGMIMAAKALLDRNPEPTQQDIKNALSGNICRCTGYENITNAILSVAQQMKPTTNRKGNE